MTDEKDLERPKTTKGGYRHPPEKSRFKTGQSGNPHGRPKGALNMATILERTLREPVIIVENGKRITVTKLEAALKQVVNQAASGKLKAVQLLATLVRSAEDPSGRVKFQRSRNEDQPCQCEHRQSDRLTARGNVPGPPWRTSGKRKPGIGS